MIDLRENLGVAMDTLRSHKVRSGLTVLGIVIGVTSVISVAAIITGLNGFIESRVASFGPNTYFMARIPMGPQGHGRQSEKIRARKHFESDFAERLRAAAPRDIAAATIFGTRASFFGASTRSATKRNWSRRSSCAAPNPTTHWRFRCSPWSAAALSRDTTRTMRDRW